MHFSPHLSFNGQCETAFQYYERHLGGKILTRFTYEGTPAADQVPPEWQKKIIHATMTIGGQSVMGADAPPSRYETPRGFSITLGMQDAAEAERVFNALADKGAVVMPLQKTFWAERFGMVIDQFNIPWMINCGPEA